MAIPGEIKCLFFSEFDPIAGPKISFQVLVVSQQLSDAPLFAL